MVFPNRIKGRKKYVQNFDFFDFVLRHSDDLQSNLFFPRSVRTDFSRSVVFNLVQRDLLKEIRFFKKKIQKKLPKSDQNCKKHQNRHEMVIHGSKWDVDHTKMIRKTRSTILRSSYCAKTIKMRV